MNAARLKVSLEVIAHHFFDDAVKIKAAFLDNDDWQCGTLTLIIEGEGLPAAPQEGALYAQVMAVITRHTDEKNLVPRETKTVKFEQV